MAYKTNYIDVNKPAKVLSINISTINNHAQWTENDGSGDRWWSGGSSPKYNQWEMTGTVGKSRVSTGAPVIFPTQLSNRNHACSSRNPGVTDP